VFWSARANGCEALLRVRVRVAKSRSRSVTSAPSTRSRNELCDVAIARDSARVSRDRAKKRDFAKKVLSRVFVKKFNKISTFRAA
jgi:hypothetical protein